MAKPDLHVVTGAFGYSGRYIAGLLLEKGKRVRTLTGHPNRPNPFGERVEAFPFNFDDPGALKESLRGAAVLYNTYWVRFNRGQKTYDEAVTNTRILIQAAKEAGVGRFVHVSITNPSEGSAFPYFRGKALVERALVESGLSHTILRPTVLFGKEDILINNIAWLLRRLPVFGVFGKGDYRLQPVYVGDLAALAVRLGEEQEDVIMDAVGPEVYTYEGLVRLIARQVGSRARLVRVAPWLGLAVGQMVGRLVRDVVVTWEEIGGLMANLLVSSSTPTCPTRLSEWLGEHGAELGARYASELRRHY